MPILRVLERTVVPGMDFYENVRGLLDAVHSSNNNSINTGGGDKTVTDATEPTIVASTSSGETSESNANTLVDGSNNNNVQSTFV